MKELIEIQRELKAPKGQTNTFGKYKYRSCEDILEAVKPLCIKHNCLLTISDEMVMLGDRFYIKATATIKAYENKDNVYLDPVSVSAYAREAESKKGMDTSQITGSASSYARKYALNGLFCIDDTKDADTMDNSVSEPEKASVRQKGMLKDYLMKFTKMNDSKAIDYIAEALNKDNLSKAEADKIIEHAKVKCND